MKKVVGVWAIIGALMVALTFAGNPYRPSKPHVFVILVDDMGFNDISFRGLNQYFTPNIDALAYNGVILKNYYVPAMCTPSRSTLMTGKYPTSTGMQFFVIDSDEPWGLPLGEKLMPEYFREAGYSTSLFGKWHLGFHRRAFLPNNRGFDHFFGYRGPYIDYWQHELHKLDRTYGPGFDMWENMRPSYETLGNYTTTLLTDKAIEYVEEYPLHSDKPMFMYLAHEAPHTANQDDPMQAPQEVIDRFAYIQDPQRRVMAAMMTVLDEQIGRLVAALDRKGILENSVILFYSDNGAPTVGLHSNKGSNYPFRGQKNSAWEGGVRSSGLIWSPLLRNSRKVNEELMHSSDWLPTLAQVAGFKIPRNANLDGKNMWEVLSENKPGRRHEVVHNVDPITPYTSFMLKNYKYINGSINPAQDIWLGDIPNGENPNADTYIDEVRSSLAWRSVIKYSKGRLGSKDIMKLRDRAQVSCKNNQVTDPRYACEARKAPCLFDIREDPCERLNLANDKPKLVRALEDYLIEIKRDVVYPQNKPLDPKSDPALPLNQNQWTFWLDLLDDQANGKI